MLYIVHNIASTMETEEFVDKSLKLNLSWGCFVVLHTEKKDDEELLTDSYLY